jgi:hypothetical protein
MIIPDNSEFIFHGTPALLAKAAIFAARRRLRLGKVTFWQIDAVNRCDKYRLVSVGFAYFRLLSATFGLTFYNPRRLRSALGYLWAPNPPL